MTANPTEERNLVFLDTETTSLRRDRRAWEVAAIVRPAGGTRNDDTEHQWFISLDDLDLGNADPQSLKIGKFYQRHPQMTRPNTGQGQLYREREVVTAIERLTRDAIIIGSKPSYDQETLEPRMHAHGLIPAWYHHPDDVPAIARGWLIGTGRAEPPIISRRTDDVARACGVEPDKYERHSGLGDCRMMRDLYDIVTAPATPDAAPRYGEAARIGTNSGHGHAWPRPDGQHARCGGPGMCAECSYDQQLVAHTREDETPTPARPRPIRDNPQA